MNWSIPWKHETTCWSNHTVKWCKMHLICLNWINLIHFFFSSQVPHAKLLAEIEANQGGLCSGASSEVLSTVGSSMNLCAFSMRKGKLAKHKLRVVRNKPGERKRTALLIVIRVIRKYTSIGSDNHHHCQWLPSSYHHHYHVRHHHENWQNDYDESVLSKSSSPSSPESPLSPTTTQSSWSFCHVHTYQKAPT